VPGDSCSKKNVRVHVRGQSNPDETALVEKARDGAAKNCPANPCRNVRTSLARGNGSTTTTRALRSNARSLRPSPRSTDSNPRSLRPNPRSLRPNPRSLSPNPRSLTPTGRSLGENARSPRPNARAPRRGILSLAVESRALMIGRPRSAPESRAVSITRETPGLGERTCAARKGSSQIERRATGVTVPPLLKGEGVRG